MDDNTQRHLQALDEWRLLVDRGETELRDGSLGSADDPQVRRAGEAVALVREVLQKLARDAEGHDRDAASAEPRHSPPRAPAARRGKSHALDMTVRSLAGTRAQRADARQPTSSARSSKRERDAVLRLGVWVTLGLWSAAGAGKPGAPRQLHDLCAALSCNDLPVPPGIAPAPGFADTPAAAAFFNDYLRDAIGRLARLYDGAGARFGRELEQPPMNGTIAMAQGWSRTWSKVATAVFIDWLDSRGDGAIDAARRSLWQYSKKGLPVQFRSPRGLAVLPTENRLIHVDLWTHLVLAQVLQLDAARWHAGAVDGRWHPVRVAMHDLHGRSAETPDGTRSVPSGLAVGMLFQALFIDRAAALAAGATFEEAAMLPSTTPSSSPPIDVPLPGCCPGQQLTMRVIWEWRQGRAGEGAAVRYTGAAPQQPMKPEQQRVYLAWQAERRARRGGASVDQLAVEDLDWRAAALPVDDAEAAGGESPVRLGHVDLWGALADAGLWLDVAAVVYSSGRWFELPLDFSDQIVGGSLRTWITLDRDELRGLAASGIDPHALQRQLVQRETSLWVHRRSGAGSFLSIGVDLTARQLPG